MSNNQDNHQADCLTKESVERSKVARQQSTQARSSREVGQVNARDDDLSTLDKELTMQYSSRDMKQSAQQKMQDRKWLDLRTLELETEDVEGKENLMEHISEQPVKQAKPPPRKKIKLCFQVPSKGFSDILHGEKNNATHTKETVDSNKSRILP